MKKNAATIIEAKKAEVDGSNLGESEKEVMLENLETKLDSINDLVDERCEKVLTKLAEGMVL